jgi:hypothetical protein
VTPKQASGVNARERLRRLAEVFAVEVRLRIVTALYKRPMSSTLFYEEFGGGSASRVNRNFERLAEAGWLRRVFSKGPGGPRRGGIEHFYRSTELAYFDAESWALVPHSMRVACSWSLFRQIAKRLRQSLEMASGKPEPGRELDCTQLVLDELGWRCVIEATDALFVAIFEEQEDSRLRASDSGETLFPIDVLLIVFESSRGGNQMEFPLVEIDKEPLIPFPERLAPVFADDVCFRIVSELNQRAMSVTQFHREFGGASHGGIRSRFRRLEKAGWLKKVGTETGGRRRGSSEHFYLATKPALVDDHAWRDPPESLRGTDRWKTFDHFCGKVLDSMRTGTFDSRLDRFVTLSFLDLDHEGVINVESRLESFVELLSNEQKRVEAGKTERSGEKGLVGVTVALAAFETPRALAKEP